MEDWLSELEMEWNQDPILNNELPLHYQGHQGVDTFDEQIALVLGEEFPYSVSTESNISSPILETSSSDPTTFSRSISVEQLSTMAQNVPSNNPSYLCRRSMSVGQLSTIADSTVPSNSPSDLSVEQLSTMAQSVPSENQMNSDHSPKLAGSTTTTSDLQQEDQSMPQKQQKKGASSNKDSKQQGASNNGRQKRKREPSQVHDHIMAERKRRELLTQRFIALSAIVPGLKKVDKTSVLGETITYLRQLQEKVKVLEEATAKQTVQSVVMIRRSQLVVDNDSVDDDGSTCSVEGNSPSDGSGGGGEGNISNSLPEIEVKICDKTVLLRIHCEKQKGVLARIFVEVEKHDMSVVNSSIFPFGSSALDITIVAQMEKEQKEHVTDLIKTLHTALRST